MGEWKCIEVIQSCLSEATVEAECSRFLVPSSWLSAFPESQRVSVVQFVIDTQSEKGIGEQAAEAVRRLPYAQRFLAKRLCTWEMSVDAMWRDKAVDQVAKNQWITAAEDQEVNRAVEKMTIDQCKAYCTGIVKRKAQQLDPDELLAKFAHQSVPHSFVCSFVFMPEGAKKLEVDTPPDFSFVFSLFIK